MPELLTSPVALAVTATFAYLLGSVPFGIVIARLFGLGDLRQIGSGNIGATNVLRTGNKFAAFLTLILDAGKGGIAVLAARMIFGAEDAAQLAGFSAFLGHVFPIWLGFRGGKGVATYLGTVLALILLAGIAACLTWLVTAILFRMSSLSALVASALLPIWLWLLGAPEMILLAIALAALIWIRHAENISRIRAGTESRIGQK